MAPVQELLLFGEAIKHRISLDELCQSVWVESTNWFSEVSIRPGIVEIKRFAAERDISTLERGELN